MLATASIQLQKLDPKFPGVEELPGACGRDHTYGMGMAADGRGEGEGLHHEGNGGSHGIGHGACGSTAILILGMLECAHMPHAATHHTVPASGLRQLLLEPRRADAQVGPQSY